jgi:glycosyltransferase involved in cell wall biosynthesis
MRILHIATLVTPDGAYGGPVRVAENQLRALAARGHEVELIAGEAGFDAVPTEIGGVPASLFPVSRLIPATGFAGLASPRLQHHVKNRLRDADVVHVHLARDLVTLPAARAVLRAGIPLVVQPHGMIDESSNPLAGPIDTLLTRAILRRSSRVLTLTDLESDSLERVAGRPLAVSRIPNGVPLDNLPTPKSGTREVLFLARLHPRKRPGMFVEMARTLLREGSDANFVLVGPNEGEGQLVSRLIEESGYSDRIRWEGALAPSETLERLARCSVYVLPSVNEIIPMSVLEAMSLGKPCVITSSNGLAEPLESARAGFVVDESVQGLTDGVRRILSNAQLADEMGRRARDLAQRDYSMDAVASQLDSIYGGIRRVEQVS